MKPLRQFDDFIKEGIVKIQSPDASRANFLIKESEKDFEFVNVIAKDHGINDKSANSIVKLAYDVLMERIRSKMLLKGYNAIGQGAHEAEVSYMRHIGFSENEVQFADQLRYHRNGMIYYGKMLDDEYASKVFSFMNKVFLRLK